MLQPRTLNRKEFTLDFSKEARLINKSLIKRINEIKPYNLPTIINSMMRYQMGMKAFYEMFALEVAKHFDHFHLKHKAQMVFTLALADIDP